MDTKLLIVIVNYRCADLTLDCLRSLPAEMAHIPNGRVVVTDNNSGDDSIERLLKARETEEWGRFTEVMPLPVNGGFAYGNNAAIRPAMESADPPDYVLLLNPDTIVREGAIRILVEFMDNHPKAGIAGSRLEDPDNTPQCSAFHFPRIGTDFVMNTQWNPLYKAFPKCVIAPPIPDEDTQREWVAGASMIICPEVFQSAEYMDENYFMYYEEVDFCYAAHKAGWECWYVPESHVIHLVGKVSGVTDTTQRKRRPLYWFESRQRYLLKNHGFVYAALSDLAWLAGYVIWRGRVHLQRKPDNDPPRFFRDFLKYSVFFYRGRGNFMLENEGVTQESGESQPGFLALLKEDYNAHGREWSRPGFRAMAVYRFGNWRMGIRPKLLRIPFSMLYRMMFRRVRNHYSIELPYSARLGRRVIIEHQGGIVVHGNCDIGDDSIIRQGVTIGNRSLDKPNEAPCIGKRVNIGAGAKILGNLNIGDDANIGANAVVLHDVEPGTTVVGIPAKPLQSKAPAPEDTA